MFWSKIARPLRLLALSAAAAVLLLGFSQPASALIINSDTMVTVETSGESFGVNYVCSTTDICGDDGSPSVELTAMSVWTVTTFEADTVVFDIEIMNTTVDPGSTTNRITAFGVKILDPDASSAVADNSSSTLDPDWTASIDTNFPTFMTIDLFIKEDSTGAAGIGEGETDGLVLTLSGFDSSVLAAGLMLEIFPIKFQGVGQGGESFEFAGTLKVPEPSNLLLFATGLLGLGVLARWRRRLA